MGSTLPFRVNAYNNFFTEICLRYMDKGGFSGGGVREGGGVWVVGWEVFGIMMCGMGGVLGVGDYRGGGLWLVVWDSGGLLGSSVWGGELYWLW